MNKKALVLATVILLAIGGGIAFLLLSSADKTPKQDVVNQEGGSSGQKIPTSSSQEITSTKYECRISQSSSLIRILVN